jgi:VWFA-related protein
MKGFHNSLKGIYSKLTLILSCCLILLLNVPVLTQSEHKKNSEIKDFGISLRQPEKNKNQLAHKSVDEKDVIRIETDLVRIDALILDQKGNVVLGLKKEDFIITENDSLQEIGTFSLGNSTEIPRSIVLIMDYSGSQIDFIKTSVEAAKVLIDQLNPKDRLAIVTDSVELLSSFSNDKELLKNRLDVLANKVINGHFEGSVFKNGELGKSLQYTALMATLNELFDDEDIRPILIFQTDGDQFFNIKSTDRHPFAPNAEIESAFTIEDLFSKVEKSRVTIYSIVSGYSLIGLSPQERLKKVAFVTEDLWKTNQFWKPGTSGFSSYTERRYLEQSSMEDIAKLSSGFTQSLENPAQANDIYSTILKTIEYRYLIGFYPTNQVRDGKRRTVKIHIRNHPEYIVWGRRTYYPPAR